MIIDSSRSGRNSHNPRFRESYNTHRTSKPKFRESLNTHVTAQTKTNREPGDNLGGENRKYQAKEKVIVSSSSNQHFRSPQFQRRGKAYEDDNIYQNKSVKKNYSERVFVSSNNVPKYY